MSDRSAAPIVLIGGANGSGKTWLAGRIAADLDFSHHLGTGFIREIVRAETDAVRDPVLFAYSFAGPDPVATLEQQADRLHAAVRRCIDRARAEGTSLVIEGTHLIPRLFADDAGVDQYIVLRSPVDVVEHAARVNGCTHLGRNLSSADLSRVRQLDQHLVAEADRYGVEVLDSVNGISWLARQLSTTGSRGNE